MKTLTQLSLLLLLPLTVYSYEMEDDYSLERAEESLEVPFGQPVSNRFESEQRYEEDSYQDSQDLALERGFEEGPRDYDLDMRRNEQSFEERRPMDTENLDEMNLDRYEGIASANEVEEFKQAQDDYYDQQDRPQQPSLQRTRKNLPLNNEMISGSAPLYN